VKKENMHESYQKKFSVQLSFEEIKLPPFDDILVLGRKCPQGKIGVNKSFELLAPHEFDVFEIDNANIEAVFINKKILKKINPDVVLKTLEEKVFPFVSESEIIKVDFKLKIFYDIFENES
jgi:hypothetical protein